MTRFKNFSCCLWSVELLTGVSKSKQQYIYRTISKCRICIFMREPLLRTLNCENADTTFWNPTIDIENASNYLVQTSFLTKTGKIFLILAINFKYRGIFSFEQLSMLFFWQNFDIEFKEQKIWLFNLLLGNGELFRRATSKHSMSLECSYLSDSPALRKKSLARAGILFGGARSTNGGLVRGRRVGVPGEPPEAGEVFKLF